MYIFSESWAAAKFPCGPGFCIFLARTDQCPPILHINSLHRPAVVPLLAQPRSCVLPILRAGVPLIFSSALATRLKPGERFLSLGLESSPQWHARLRSKAGSIFIRTSANRAGTGRSHSRLAIFFQLTRQALQANERNQFK